MFRTVFYQKHVEFYFKNKFEELVRLVGFIIRIYHDAWSPECQMLNIKQYCYTQPSIAAICCYILRFLCYHPQI